ncbi:hypothetical protein V6615_12160 [Oscillospiraceae bacterium PP1C4]
MKKTIFVLLLLALFLLTTFTACGEEENTFHKDKNGLFEPTGIGTSPSSADTSAVAQAGPLTLTVVGENKLLVTLTDERVNGFLDFDETSTFQNTFRIFFFAETTQKLSISMTPYSWDISGAEDMSQGGIPDLYVNGQKDTYQISGNTISFEINQAEIAGRLSACNNYTMYFHDKNGQQEMLAGGSLSDVVNAQESGETICIAYWEKDQAIVRVAGATFDRYLAGGEYQNLKLGFYLPGNDSYVPLYELRLSAGTDLLSSKLYQLTLRENEGIMDSEELIGERHNNAVRTDDGYSFQLFYKGIESLLSSCDRIVVTDDENKTLLTESYENAVTGEVVQIPALPDTFESSAQDGNYFYPVTDDYIVIMLDMPLTTVLDYGYYTADDGNKYYAPGKSHEAPLKIISIISYNEFGIADKRTKIIYDSIASAMSASADRLDWYPVSQITGDKGKDSDVLADFMESLDQKTFSNSPNSSESYQYFGHYDNVRYFAATMDQINFIYNYPPLLSYDQNSAFGADGFLTETIPYSYDFPNFEINRSLMRDSTATVTVFSSKAANR